MRALLSVADRTGITDLTRDLLDQGVEVFATDGTREALAADGVQVSSISALTAAPPVIGGQVKTFHPEIYAGILARRNVPSDLESLVEHGIGLIDVVVVNVAPFAPQVGTGLVPIDEALAMIDIGGVALLSAAARNYAAVVVASNPSHYPLLVEELQERGHVSPETRLRLAAQAFAAVAAYDAEVAAYLHHISGVRFPEELTVVLRKQRDLAYGANPQQRAALYLDSNPRPGSIADAAQLQGPEPTFNDLLDLDAAWRIAATSRAPRAASRSSSTRSAWHPTICSWGIPGSARYGPGRGVRCGRGRQPGGGCGDRGGDRAQRLRGARGTRLLRGGPGGARHAPGADAAGGDPRLLGRTARRSGCPTWTCTASMAGCWSRPRTGRCSTTRSSMS